MRYLCGDNGIVNKVKNWLRQLGVDSIDKVAYLVIFSAFGERYAAPLDLQLQTGSIKGFDVRYIYIYIYI
jgi:hypothetical protein